MPSLFWKDWFHKKTILDHKPVTRQIAEALYCVRRLSAEVDSMHATAATMLNLWNERLKVAMKELDETLERGNQQPNKDKY